MDNQVKTVKSFIRQFVAYVQGDDATQLAEKVYRKSSTALSAQIASLESQTVDLEDVITEKEEELLSAIHNNGKEITGENGKQEYIKSILRAKQLLETAKETLSSHQETVAFLKTTLEEINSEA